MSTVSVSPNLALRCCELMKLFSVKASYQIEEYVDCGTVYKRLREAAESKETSVEVSEIDLKYVLSAISICSQRTPVEAQNYKAIADLIELLTTTLKGADVEEVEETKTDL